MDVSDIFYFSFLLGEGEGGVRGAKRGGEGRFLLKIPGGGGGSRRGRGFPGGLFGAIGEFGGGSKYFFSGPKRPPRKGFSAGFSVTPKETKNTRGYWAQQYIGTKSATAKRGVHFRKDPPMLQDGAAWAGMGEGSKTLSGRLRVRLEERLGKPMGLDSEPFLKPIGRANSTRGQP